LADVADFVFWASGRHFSDQNASAANSMVVAQPV